MIWDTDKMTGGGELVSYVADEISAICGADLRRSPEKIEALAWAIDRYLKLDGKSAAVTSKYLVMLASQALSSIGEDEAARRLFIFGMGMAAPSEWTVTRGESMLVLDLKRMTLRSDAVLEIVFFSSLNMAIEAMADFWDEEGGAGVLGLRHICSAAEVLLGDSRSEIQEATLVHEIMDACRDKLEQVRSLRNWTEVPDVMNLDL